tara:strand:+ start:545 stop:697 length:153 start_codon:yes stop_codon:yes gene_type:complete
MDDNGSTIGIEDVSQNISGVTFKLHFCASGAVRCNCKIGHIAKMLTAGGH